MSPPPRSSSHPPEANPDIDLLPFPLSAGARAVADGHARSHVLRARGPHARTRRPRARCYPLFLALAVGKSYALLLVRRETCLVLRTRPCDALEWVSLACVACFAYVSYVASLAYQRLIHAYLIASFVRNPDERAESGDAPARERER